MLCVIEEGATSFLLDFGGVKIREEKKGYYCAREKK
jgi:hypothetical protein